MSEEVEMEDEPVPDYSSVNQKSRESVKSSGISIEITEHVTAPPISGDSLVNLEESEQKASSETVGSGGESKESDARQTSLNVDKVGDLTGSFKGGKSTLKKEQRAWIDPYEAKG